MSEKSDTFKLVNAVELAKEARVGMELTYFDVVALIDDLREENANLTARIAELEEKQRWIPVSERLPEDGEHVLAAYVDTMLTVAYYRHHIAFGGEVTHWMPLPELPEESKKW